LTLTPSQAPPAKRMKPEPTALINVKEEAGMAKSTKMVITPEVSYDGEEGGNTTNDQVIFFVKYIKFVFLSMGNASLPFLAYFQRVI